MKRLMICIALMSSASAFAGPVQEGTMILLQGKAQVAKNIIDITLARNAVNNIADDLKDLDVRNEELKKVNAICSTKLIASGEELFSRLDNYYVTDINDRLSRNYAALKESAAKLEKAESCLECDQEIKKLTVEKYLVQVNNALYNMKNSISSVPANTVENVLDNRICNYSKFFSFDDSKQFTELKEWGSANYTANLAPSEVLSGEFNETLDLIVRKAPIKVKRTASRLSSESSSYKRGVVSINISYTKSIITGIDNVRHPEMRNAVEIIHRDR